MAENTKIGWTDKTFNHVRGCAKVSAACKHCYADAFSSRNPKTLGVFGTESQGGTRVVAAENYWKQPLRWNRDAAIPDIPVCAQCGACAKHELFSCPQCGLVIDRSRPRVFCASLADVFEDWRGPMLDHLGSRLLLDYGEGRTGQVLPEGEAAKTAKDWCDLTMNDVRQRLFNLIDETPNLDWLLLTKRPENILRMVNRIRLDGGTTGRVREWDIETPAHPYFRKNVWLGTTVENQEWADKRIPELLKCSDLAPVLFLSMEPLLGPVNFGVIPFRTRPSSEVTSQGALANDWTTLYGNALSGFRASSMYSGTHDNPSVGWVIVGCESGPNRRETKLEWVRSIRDQCQRWHVPLFVKQLEIDGKVTTDVNKFPEDLRIQEFPCEASQCQTPHR